jgi:excisionase family DNA binding protein
MEKAMLPSASANGSTHVVGPASLGVVSFDGACELLEVSRPTLERLIRSDEEFPRPFKIGGRRYVRFADLVKWVDRCAEKARAA